MSTEFKIGLHTYKSGDMNAITQFHVVRRLAPVVEIAKDVLKKMDNPLAAFGLLATAISKLSDDDANFIIEACLSIVQRKQSGDTGWANVWSPQAKRAMFDDIDLKTMLGIVARVVMDNLAPFIAALPQVSTDGLNLPVMTQ